MKNLLMILFLAVALSPIGEFSKVYADDGCKTYDGSRKGKGKINTETVTDNETETDEK